MIAALAALVAGLAVGAYALSSDGGSADTAPSLPADRQAVPAPIDGVDIRVLESNPAQYVLGVKAGLPGGCARAHSSSLSRSGETITVAVLNSMPTGAVACTMIYGSYDLSFSLGSDFRPGTTYTVRVNDRATTFTAR